MSDKPTGREALDEIERRFSQLLGRLGQTFEEAMSLKPGKSPLETRVQSFSGTVEEFLAKRRAATVDHATEPPAEAETAAEAVTDAPANGADIGAADGTEATTKAPLASVSIDVPGGRVRLDVADPAAASGSLSEVRFGAAWRVSVAGGTLRFDPD